MRRMNLPVRTGSRRLRPGPTALLVTGVLTAAGRASAPTDPLPPPVYSFDAASPKVVAALVRADSLLEFIAPDLVTVLTGAELGAGGASDDVDALSAANSNIVDLDVFAILFSIDRESRGAVPPDPALVAAGTPYNAMDQADRGHAAGDQFMTTLTFSLDSGATALSSDPNNLLVRNNFDEGGHDFVADPETSADDSVPPNRAAEDNVDATALFYDRTSGQAPANVYFSLSSTSSSLASLSGATPPSGANLFYNPAPAAAGLTTMFAGYGDLGLVQADDVDAMTVIDRDADGVFGGSDVVLFSLAPGSPSLTTIVGASAVGAAADVFRVDAGGPSLVFAAAAQLGLGNAADNVDALDLSFGAAARAASHGIRRVCGDFDNDGDAGADDFAQFEACFSSSDGAVQPGCERADCAATDGVVDCSDWLLFLAAWSETEPPPLLTPCAGFAGVPAAGEWGLVLLTLLVLAMGTILIRRRPVPFGPRGGGAEP